MTAKKIIDDLTDKPLSKARKWQLRHPDKHKQIQVRWEKSENGKASRRRYYDRKKKDDSEK